MLKKNPLLWGSLVVLLAALNLAKWMPALWPSRASKEKAGASFGLALEFPSGVQEGEKTVHRDLFTLGSRGGSAAGVRRARKAAAPAAVQTGPTPTPTFVFPDGSLREAAGGYRLMGVVSRGGQSKALIGKGDQLFQLGSGEDLEGLYQVENIGDDEVYLTDKRTGNSLRLHIWNGQGTP